MGERWLCKPEVIGSIPFSSTKFLHRFVFLALAREAAECHKSRRSFLREGVLVL